MIFTFCGGGNSNYTSYLLEMICDLELESSTALREAILSSMLINITGEEGKWQPGDIIQEFLNRCIEPIIQRKDASFGSNAVREIWARNLKDIYDLKQHLRASVALAKRSSRHKKPHERPEVKTLLKEFKKAELHKRRPGRSIGEVRDVDDFRKGMEMMENGVLQKWALRTVRSRGLNEDNPQERGKDGGEGGEDEHEDEDGDEEVPMTLGVLEYHDGEVMIMLDGEDELDALLEGELREDETIDEDGYEDVEMEDSSTSSNEESE